MAKLGLVSRSWGALGALGRRVSSVVRDERATAFGRRARQRFRELKRRLGWYDEDAYEDGEEQRRRRRARQMIGLHDERGSDAAGLDAEAARVEGDEAELESQMTRERLSSATFTAGAPAETDQEEEGR